MNDDYTPTTEEVRDYFAHGQFSDLEEREGVARFNRWLVEHDRQIAEKAFREGVDAGKFMAGI